MKSVHKLRYAAGALATAMVALFAHTAPAQTWTGGSGSWSIPSNWNGGVPGTGGDVLLGVSSTSVTLDVSSATLNTITIGAANGTTLTIQGTTLTATNAVVGQSGTGAISQSSGLVTILGSDPTNSDLILGATTGAVGTYLISSGTLLVDIMTVGSGSTAGGTYGTGTFTQSGGMVDMTQSGGNGQLYVGDAAGSDGSYFLQSGSLKAVDEFVGVSSSTSGTHVGQRQFVQSGGTNNLAGSLTLGDSTGAVGSYSIGGANSVLTVAGNEFIGASGSGSFTQTGGVNTINTVTDSTGFLILGESAGSSGNYGLVAGTLTAGYELVGNAGVGSFTQSAGLNTASQALDVVNGIYTVSSGTFTTPFAVIGDSDSDGVAHSGTFLQLGGLVTITGSDASSPDLILGATTDAVGTYQINSGTLRVDIMTVGSGSTADGTHGTGVFTQSGGVVDLTQSGSAGQLYVGDAAGSDGSYFLQSGSLGAVDEFVGVSSSTSGTHVGQRQFVQSGGTNNLAGSLTIGDFSGAAGSYSIGGANSVLTVAGNEIVGASGTGSFTQTGGVNTVNTVTDSTGFLILGESAGSSGNYGLVAGTLTAGYELVGNAGVGSLTQSAGLNTASQALDVVNGIYTITGGTFTTPFAIIGDSDSDSVGHSGTFSQAGGLVTITGSDASSSDLILGATTGAAGSYQISSGTLRADVMTVGSGSTADGTHGTGVFTQSGGVVDLTQSGSGGQLYVGDAAGSDGSYNLQSGSLHAVDEFVGVSTSTSGTHTGVREFVQSGGTNSLAGSLTLGDSSGATGSYSLSGAASSHLTVAGNEYIGSSGTGTFTQEGGVNNVNNVSDSTGFLVLGGGAGGSGTYNLSSGSLIAGYEVVGYASGGGGVGSFTQTGGTNTVTQALLIDTNSSYTLSGGSLVISGTGDGTGLDNGSVFNLAGGTLGGAGQKLNEGNMNGYGTINGTGDLVNGAVSGTTVLSTGTVTFQSGLSSVNSNVVNNPGSKININAITVFAGSVTNNGTITTNHTSAFYYGSVSGSGAFISDPSTTTFYGAYTLSNPGYIAASNGDKYQFGNDVDITTSNNTQWSTRTAEMDIISGTYTSATVLHSFVYPGLDFGQSNAGYNGNYAWKILSIDDNNYLVNSSGALYTSILELGSASDPTAVTALALNFTGSLDIYYDPSLVANAYLNDQTYDFGSGGGEILPIPEPSTLILFPTGLFMAFALWRRRRRFKQAA